MSTIRELIEQLEEAAGEYGDEVEVRLAMQPNYPFEYSIGQVNVVDLRSTDGDPDGEPQDDEATCPPPRDHRLHRRGLAAELLARCSYPSTRLGEITRCRADLTPCTQPASTSPACACCCALLRQRQSNPIGSNIMESVNIITNAIIQAVVAEVIKSEAVRLLVQRTTAVEARIELLEEAIKRLPLFGTDQLSPLLLEAQAAKSILEETDDEPNVLQRALVAFLAKSDAVSFAVSEHLENNGVVSDAVMDFLKQSDAVGDACASLLNNATINVSLN